MNWPGGGDLTGADAATWGPILAPILAFVIAWLALCSVTGWLAGRKNRDSGLWFVLAFFTGPIALVAVWLKSAAPRKD